MIINNIKKYRILNELTQEDLAYKTNISLSQIRNIETNRSYPGIEIVLKIAKVLNTKVEDLFIIDED